MAAVNAFYGGIAFHNYMFFLYIYIYIYRFSYIFFSWFSYMAQDWKFSHMVFLMVFLYGSSLEVFPYCFPYGFPKRLKLEGSPILFSSGFPFIFFDYLLRVSATTIHYFNAIMAVLMFVSAIVICCFVLSAVLLY